MPKTKTPEQTHPTHFTPEDILKIAEIEAWMLNKNYTQAALARLSRISSSSLNQILKGVYATSPTKLLGNVTQAIQNFNEEKEGHVETPVETTIYKLAHTACKMARKYRNFAVFTGFVGTGKTFAIKRYAEEHPNTHLIEATPTMTAQSLVKLLARVVAGFEGKGSIDDKFRAICEALKNTDSLLIVDEAETLTAAQLHTLRRVRDLANVGIVLCGTEHLSGLIKPHHGQFDQIRSRTGFWPPTAQGITQEDCAALTQAGLGAEDISDEVINRLHAYSKGSARMLVEGLIASLREFRKGQVLDVDLVDAVAKQALCLQPLPPTKHA